LIRTTCPALYLLGLAMSLVLHWPCLAQYPLVSGYSGAIATEGNVGEGRYAANRISPQQRYRPVYLDQGDYRQPISVLVRDAEEALIATKLTGEIYQLNLRNHSLSVVYKETGRQLRRMIPLGEPQAGAQIAVTDIGRNEVLILAADAGYWRELATLDIPGRPQGICYDAEQSQLWVTSLWGQRLFRFQLTAGAPEWLQTIDLPMCGGEVVCLSKPGLVLVTDAFGSNFVVLDQRTAKVINQDAFFGYNIPQVIVLEEGEVIMYPHQLVNELTAALQTDITWGNFLSNNLRWLRTERLMSSAGKELYTGSEFAPIGSVGNGAGDPTSVAVSPTGNIAVTIGGTNQVAIGSLTERRFDFVNVGFRPVDCQFTPDEAQLVVANQFSDSVSIIDLATQQVDHVSLGAIRPPTTAERGEMLFHDSTLSHDGWMSCQSCHSGGHTNGKLTDNFTDNSYQSPKRVLSLLGQAETAPYGWAGTMPTLEHQIAFSIRSTMASDDEVRHDDVQHLAAFVRSLPPPPSIHQARSTFAKDRQLVEDVKRGQKLFEAIGCSDCHTAPNYTSPATYDVGLQDERSLTEFNPPSLLGISQRETSLFHDGSARSIEDVIVKERHQLPHDLTPDQQRQLIRFLESL